MLIQEHFWKGDDIDVDPRINNLMNDWCQIGTNYSSYLLNCLISQ